MGVVTLPTPKDRGVRSPVSPHSENEFTEPERKDSGVSSLLKFGVLMWVFTCPLVYVLSVSLGQEPPWPLRNISQYGAHVPAVYFFRVAGIASGVFTIQVGLLLRHQVRWFWVLMPAGVCSIGSATVSHTENNGLHTAFAVFFFSSMGVIEACAAHTAWTHRNHPLFRSPGLPLRARFWAVCAAYTFCSVAAAGNAIVIGLEKQVEAPKGPHPSQQKKATPAHPPHRSNY